MSTALAHANVAAIASGINLHEDDILGYLEFHQIPEMRVPKDEMANLWGQHNLDPKFLPAKIFPADAFRRATSAAACGNIEINDANRQKVKARLLVREVVNDDNLAIRHLVREVVDSKNEVLYYNKVGAWRFDKKTNKVEDAYSHGALSEYPYDVIVQDSTQLVSEFLNYHTRDTVRNLIAKVIRDSNPTPIMHRSQGKFIPKQYNHCLAGLQSLLKDLEQKYAPGTDCNMDLIPIVNTVEQKEMLTRKASFALKEESETLIEEFAKIMKGKQEINQKVAERLIRNALEVKDKIKEYEELLDTRMDLINKQLQNFVHKVKIVPVEQKS